MKAYLLHIALIIVLSWLPAHGKDSGIIWSSLGNQSDAYDNIMEKAAFLDVPRRDLANVVMGFNVPHDNKNFNQSLARVLFWKAWLISREHPDSAEVMVNRALTLCDSASFPYDKARFAILKADILRINGNLAAAYSLYKQNFQILDKFNDNFWKGKVDVGIGVIMQDLSEFHEALRYYEEAQNYFEKAGSIACKTKNRINIANLQYMIGKKGEALNTLDGIENNNFVISDSIYLANVFVSKFHISEFEDSLSAINAYEISKRIDNRQLSVISLQSMGMLRHKQGDQKRGLLFLNAALHIADSLRDFSNLKRILAGLEECYRITGLADSANLCHSRMLAINDSVYRHEKIDSLKKQEHLATINQYEQRLREEKQSGKWKLFLTVTICGSVIIILALLFYLLWISKRKSEINRLLQEEKNRRLELINTQYSLEIEAKQNELSSNTILMAQKNAQLKELASQIEKLKGKGLPDETDSLTKTISKQLTADDDWRYFKLRFDKVHPNFFDKIKDEYPSLTKTDLRLCAYIRVGMSAKEIAQVLSVKTDTVNTSRYRIRKKMNLSPDTTIESVIDKF